MSNMRVKLCCLLSAIVFITSIQTPSLTASAIAPECKQIMSVQLAGADENGVRSISADTSKPIELTYQISPNLAATKERDPLDVILIAETAETMAQDFDGNELKPGSSDPNQRINAMKKSLKKFNQLISQINSSKLDKDRVALVEFDRKARIKVPYTENYASIEQSISSLKPVDTNNKSLEGKNFGDAFQLASDLITKHMKNMPIAPKQVVATMTSSGHIKISWEASVDATTLKYYEVYRSNNSMFNYVKIAETKDTIFLDQDVSDSQNYDYYIVTVDSSNTKSEPSESIRITTKSDSSAPTAPGTLSVSEITNDSALLTWGTSFDNTGIRHYQVLVDNQLVTTTTSLAHRLTNLNENRSHLVAIRAFDLAGNRSPASNSVRFITANLKKYSFFYDIRNYAVPRINFKFTDKQKWTTDKMERSDAFGVFKKVIFTDQVQKPEVFFSYIDNSTNYFPNFFEAYQPRSNKKNSNQFKIIGSNPKPALIVDDIYSENISSQVKSSNYLVNRSENSAVTFNGEEMNFTEKADQYRDKLPTSSDFVTIYYKSGGVVPKNPVFTPFLSPHINYSIDGTEWTAEQGIKMLPSTIAGYHYFTINLDDESELKKISFNDGNPNENLRKSQDDNKKFFAGKMTSNVMIYDPATNRMTADNPNKHQTSTIYYKSNGYTNAEKSYFQSPYLHFTLNGNQWTKYPGIKMKPSLIGGYHYLTIDLESESAIERLVFSDGGTLKDEQNGGLFRNIFKAGEFMYDPEKRTIQKSTPKDFLDSQNVVNIYYKSDELFPKSGVASIKEPYVDYNLNGRLIVEPGIPMVPSGITGYHTIQLPIGNNKFIKEVEFTDGNKIKQNNNGSYYDISAGNATFYPVNGTLVKSMPRDIIGRKKTLTNAINKEIKFTTVYYHSESLNGIKQPYIKIKSNTNKIETHKMYSSEWKGYHKYTLPVLDDSPVQVSFTNENETLVQMQNGAPLALSMEFNTFIPVSQSNGTLLEDKPPNYEPDTRKKIVIFLSDGLPNISPNTGQLELNGAKKYFQGQERENPFVDRLGYQYAKTKLEELVSLGAQVHVIAIGSDNAVNIDTAAIDLHFLEYIATVGNGDFLRAEDAEKFQIRLKDIGSLITTQKISNVELRQALPDGLRLPNGVNIADAYVDNALYEDAVSINNNELLIRLNEIPLIKDTKFKVRVNVQAQFGGEYQLKPATLSYPYLNRFCRVGSEQNYNLDVTVIQNDRYGNKYEGKTNGDVTRYTVNGSKQWTVNPFSSNKERASVKRFRFAADDTTVIAEYNDTQRELKWNLLPTAPDVALLKNSSGSSEKLTNQNSFITSLTEGTSITDVSGGEMSSPSFGGDEVPSTRIEYADTFRKNYISGYEYSLTKGQSWKKWTDGKSVPLTTSNGVQMLAFRALTKSISNDLFSGPELTGSYKNRIVIVNQTPKIEISDSEQPEYILNKITFANKANDLTVNIKISDDQLVSNQFEIKINGKSVTPSPESIISRNGGKEKVILLNWKKLYPEPKDRLGEKAIEVAYEDANNAKATDKSKVKLNVGPFVRLLMPKNTEVTTYNKPVSVTVDMLSLISNMKLSTPEYQLINRPITYRGNVPLASNSGWKKLGSKKFTVASEGINYIYVRVRDQDKLSSDENGYSPINKMAPIIVRINYAIGRQ